MLFYIGVIVFGVFAAKETTAIRSFDVDCIYLVTLSPPFVYYTGKVNIRLIGR